MLDKLNEKLKIVQQGKAEAQRSIASLDKQREQTVAILNANIGAEQVLLQLIEEINKENEVKADENVQN